MATSSKRRQRKWPCEVGGHCSDNHEQEVDNSRILLEKIVRGKTEEIVSDVTLVVNSIFFPVHRMMLCVSSDVFRVMLMNPNFTESHEHTIFLKEDPQCADVFPEFLRYLYEGVIRMSHETVLPLLLLADKYNVKDLTPLCLGYMEAHVVTAAKNNRLISWIQYTMRHGKAMQYHSFNERSRNFICWNFELVSDLPEFRSLETEILVELLQRDDLVIKDEFCLFKCISKWLMHQLSKHPVPGKRSTSSSCIVNESDGQLSFPKLAKEIMSHIRFPLMSYRELANVLMDPIAKDYEYLMIERITEAMRFNAIGDEARDAAFRQMKADFSCETSPFTPRLYTNEMWSSSLVIENYNDIPKHTTRTFVFETATTLFDNAPKADHTMSSKRLRTTEPTAVQEWAVYLYPKGVFFERAKLISCRGRSVHVPSWQRDTVRIAVSTARPYSSKILFNVGILVYGQQDGLEFVRHVCTRRRFFEGDERVLQIEELVPFNELNVPPAMQQLSPLLIGDDRNTLRIQVVITPIGC